MSNAEASPEQQDDQAGEGGQDKETSYRQGCSQRVSRNIILEKINWENHGIHIDGEHLAHLDFADDVIMMAHTPQELEKILNDFYTTSKPFGLNMHLGKTKVMFNKHDTPANIFVDGTILEQVESYIYLARTIMQDGSLLPEVKKRIKLERAATGKVNNMIRSRNASRKVKRKSSTNTCRPCPMEAVRGNVPL